MKKEVIIWLLPFVFYLFYLLIDYDLSILKNSHIMKDISALLFPFIFSLTFYFIYNDYPITYILKKISKK